LRPFIQELLVSGAGVHTVDTVETEAEVQLGQGLIDNASHVM
jgi:hypothetical protein